MELSLSIAGIAFAAFCIWLGVRVYNRRERWAKRTAVGIIIASPLFYVASFGPACWIASRSTRPEISIIYLPIGSLFGDAFVNPIEIALIDYARAGMPVGSTIQIPVSASGWMFLAR